MLVTQMLVHRAFVNVCIAHKHHPVLLWCTETVKPAIAGARPPPAVAIRYCLCTFLKFAIVRIDLILVGFTFQMLKSVIKSKALLNENSRITGGKINTKH